MSTTTAVSERRIHERRTGTDALVRDAHRVLDACGVVRSPSWVSRTVRDYRRSPVNGLPFGHFLLTRVELNAQQRAAVLAREDVRYLLGYSDPTGEQAVANVLREARHAR